MLRFIGIASLICVLSACQVQSQEQPAPQRVPLDSVDLGADITRSRQNAITRAVAAASPAVVTINVVEVRQARDPFGRAFDDDPIFRYFFRGPNRRQLVRGVGSGFIISPDGYIVTNDHVAGSASEIEVLFPDGRAVAAELVGTDGPSDLALLKIDAEEPLPYLEFDTTSAAIAGEWVVALGNPFGLFGANEPTVTVGVVSATDRDLQSGRNGRLYRDMIQTDAAINQGNSGGPLINALGQVIGVNTAIYSESGGSVGIGFAVPARKAARILDELRTNGAVDRSYYTGLYVINVNDRVARALDLNRVQGVLVRDIDPGSPAAETGIQPYDVIVAIEGERIQARDDYVARVYDFRPGDTVEVEIIREGERIRLPLRIGSRAG